MKEKLKILKQRYENQIENAFETLIEIQELEGKVGPCEHLSNFHKTALGMMFASLTLRNLWDKMEKANLSNEQREKLVFEIGETTYNHYKELYDFDSRKIAENI